MGKIAFLFAGQGSQGTGMGRALAEISNAANRVFTMAEVLRPGTRSQCYGGSKEDLSITVNTQPCLFCVDLAAAEALRECGISPYAVAGFSLGEIPALAFAGMLSMEDAFRLVCLRAQVMHACTQGKDGGMMAVMGLPTEMVEAFCRESTELFAVNYNCPGQLVVAGRKSKLAQLGDRVREAGGRGIVLAVSGAFHSPDMVQAQVALQAYLEQTHLAAPAIPVYANLTARPYAPPYARALASQAAQPVRWQETLENMAADGVTTFIEVGPGKTLSGFVRKTLPNVVALNVEDAESLMRTMDALNGEKAC
ncbi:MAG: ACP S-malonyltransferase [Clostridiales bacterium]|nr:ACP S-malonyltransferase [Clostridiales bacterium]